MRLRREFQYRSANLRRRRWCWMTGTYEKAGRADDLPARRAKMKRRLQRRPRQPGGSRRWRGSRQSHRSNKGHLDGTPCAGTSHRKARDHLARHPDYEGGRPLSLQLQSGYALPALQPQRLRLSLLIVCAVAVHHGRRRTRWTRSCGSDGGFRPSGVCLQGPAPKRPVRHWLKTVVVSVGGKVGSMWPGRYGSRRRGQANHREGVESDHQTSKPGATITPGTSPSATCLLGGRCPA
jgi:hypothetical protein